VIEVTGDELGCSWYTWLVKMWGLTFWR
jgi:hypothetical protein